MAIAMKDLRQLGRYPLNLASLVFMPLYQGLIPSILFGAAFLVGGRALGLEAAVGSGDLAGFLFLGAVVSGVTASTYWSTSGMRSAVPPSAIASGTRRSSSARISGIGSDAMTFAPLGTSSRVSLPVPAARSSTVRPGRRSSRCTSLRTAAFG